MELHSCPFCGNAAVKRENSAFYGDFLVYCTNCGAMGPTKESALAASDAWNRRVYEPFRTTSRDD